MKVTIETDVWIRDEVPIKSTVAIHIRPENSIERERLDEIYEDILHDIGYTYGYWVTKVGFSSSFDLDEVEISEIEVRLGTFEGSSEDVEEFIEEKAETAEEISSEIKDMLEDKGINVVFSKNIISI